MKWKYLSLTYEEMLERLDCRVFPEDRTLMRSLKDLGELEWELITVTPFFSTFMYIFKKPIPE
jgi:hypothetical protein